MEVMPADHTELLARLTDRQRRVWDALSATPGLSVAELSQQTDLDATEQLRSLERRGLLRSFPGTGGPFLYPADPPGLEWPRPPARAPVPPDAATRFQHRREGGLLLVLPTATKQAWRPEERPWRSVVLDAGRRVVSTGFPKFFTVGEDGRTDAALKRALGRGEPLTVSEKLDGSLVIRSVWEGRVMLRTRGTLDAAGELGAAVKALCAARHPGLLDPASWPDCSLLLEFCSPEHRVVLPYAADALTLVGAVDHGWPPRLAHDADLARLAAETGLGLVATHTGLPAKARALRDEVSAWEDREGVVVRLEAGQTLVKLKSDDYRRRHGLRFGADGRALEALLHDRGVRDEDELVAHLLDEGASPETADAARGWWRERADQGAPAD